VHTREAEAWFLIQGTMTYRAGERLIRMSERRLPDAGVSDADIERWLELSPRYGLRVVGPPIPEAEA